MFQITSVDQLQPVQKTNKATPPALQTQYVPWKLSTKQKSTKKKTHFH